MKPTVVKDDSQLIEEALAGETVSFGKLVRKYQDRLYNTLVHVTGSRHEAEDVAQEAFLQAYTKLSSFQGKSNFYTWLYRIAFNTSISRRRRRRSQASLDQVQEKTGCEPADPSDAPDAQLQRQERVELLRAALNELSEEHRRILVLREIDGCCYETISEALCLPVGTVRSRLHRARIQLRDRLKQVLQEN